MASIKEYEKRLEALEAETAGYRGGKVITFAVLYDPKEILSASVDGQDVERLDGETDKDFRARVMKQYAGPATLTVGRIHYARPRIDEGVFVESKAANPEPAKEDAREAAPVVNPAPVEEDKPLEPVRGPRAARPPVIPSQRYRDAGNGRSSYSAFDPDPGSGWQG